MSEKLNVRVPAFTKHLAPGLGFAEDPGTIRDSFGTHRCRLLAEGTLRPAIDSKFSMQDIAKAHARLESNETVGKIVVMME